jgi:hypothetical protein
MLNIISINKRLNFNNSVTNTLKIAKFCLVTYCAIALVQTSAYAFVENAQQSSSRSLHINNKILEQTSHQNTSLGDEALQTHLQALSLVSSGTESRKSRVQVIKERNEEFSKKNTSSQKRTSVATLSDNYVRFDIYSASSRLLEDFDYDGFFQTFSVTFDADIFGNYAGERALVFADLYLSRNGGPWELYFTTDPFVIKDDSSEDQFEVITTLDSGYRTGNYDVLIDLYEIGYSDIVSTISSNDVDALYALPLESADRDEYYPNDIYVSGGSVSIFGLLALTSIIAMRIFSTKRTKY